MDGDEEPANKKVKIEDPVRRSHVEFGAITVSSIGLGTLALGVGYNPGGRPPIATFRDIVNASADEVAPDVPLYVDCCGLYCHPYTNRHELTLELAQIQRDRPGALCVGLKSGMERFSNESTGWRPASTDLRRLRKDIEADHAAMGGTSPLHLWMFHHAMHFKEPGMIEQAMEVVKECVAKGLVRNAGLCNATVPLLDRARSVHPILCVQNEWSIYCRKSESMRDAAGAAGSEKGVLQYCADNGIVFVAHSPLDGITQRRGERTIPPKRLAALNAITTRVGCSNEAAMLACLLHRGRSVGAKVVLIPGARTVAHAVDSVGAVRLVLTDDEVSNVMDTEAEKRMRRGLA